MPIDARWGRRLAWNAATWAGMLAARLGGWRLTVLALVLLSVIGAVAERHYADQLQSLRHRHAIAELQVSKDAQAQAPKAVPVDDRDRLREFEALLVAHDEIPQVIQDLLDTAEKSGLRVMQGDYRPQEDAAGKFMRYRMILPVKGSEQAVRRFMGAALLANRSLVLESVQFRREQALVNEVEARMQWVLLARAAGTEPVGASKVVAWEKGR